MITINEIFKDILTTSRGVNSNYPFEAKLAKLTEEHGEFSTAVQIERSRGHEVLADLVGLDYAGRLIHDGFCAYDLFSRAAEFTASPWAV